MTELVVLLSTGKGSWMEVGKLVEAGSFSRVFYVTNEFGKDKFSKRQEDEFIVVNFNKATAELMADISTGLDKAISGEELAVNFISGSGHEHMALMGALMKLGVGFRLIALKGNAIEVL